MNRQLKDVEALPLETEALLNIAAPDTEDDEEDDVEDTEAVK